MALDHEGISARITEKPVLFMKAGVMCSSPYDFFDSLAEEYDADLLDPEAVRGKLCTPDMDPADVNISEINTEMVQQTVTSLRKNNNVVYEGFVNTVRRRKLLADIAARLGTASMLLVVHAPLSVVTQRIHERHAAQEMNNIALSSTVWENILHAKKMWHNVEFPESDENPLNLDGKQTTEQLLRIVRAEMETRGLIHPDTAPEPRT